MNVISFRMLCAPCSAVFILIEIIIAHLLGQTLLFSLSRPSSVPIKFSMKSNLLLLVDTLIGFYWYLWIIDSHKQRRNKKDTMNSSHLSPPEALTSNLKFLCHIRKTFPLSQLLRQARGNWRSGYRIHVEMVCVILSQMHKTFVIRIHIFCLCGALFKKL